MLPNQKNPAIISHDNEDHLYVVPATNLIRVVLRRVIRAKYPPTRYVAIHSANLSCFRGCPLPLTVKLESKAFLYADCLRLSAL